ncbi:hypothetical protein ACM26V_04470 [Salipaludibacillus sp. HK11]|uniref:hypothetical protein n=1 Tax=Salipaludibacillus sp. HK11 TaxID=3394320 RepID=UPI0039FD28F5
MRFYLILISFLFLLSACDSDVVSEEAIEPNEPNVEESELKEEEAYLLELTEEYESEDFPHLLYERIQNDIEEIENIEDEDTRQAIIQLANDAVLKIIKNRQDGSPILNNLYLDTLFTSHFVFDRDDVRFKEYLYESTIEEALLSLGIDPINNTNSFIKNNELEIVIIEKLLYLDIEPSNETFQRQRILEEANEEGRSYEFIYANNSGFLVLDNSNAVIDFGEGTFLSTSVERIFTIENKEGEVLDPHVALEEDAKRRAEVSSERQAARSEERERKEKEQSSISLGMTSGEVEERWGKPDNINRTVTTNTVREQWIYGSSIANRRYLYFTDDILTSWQD